uniref:hypothetical protein n=1 Tax=Thaumasiovibrio occultus TaxID=1891184 RepID=UPI001863E6A3|nr:hypothetical protein [Thaumasiovibrio occultus]
MQILIMMAILIVAFVWRTLNYHPEISNSVPCQQAMTCSSDPTPLALIFSGNEVKITLNQDMESHDVESQNVESISVHCADGTEIQKSLANAPITVTCKAAVEAVEVQYLGQLMTFTAEQE